MIKLTLERLHTWTLPARMCCYCLRPFFRLCYLFTAFRLLLWWYWCRFLYFVWKSFKTFGNTKYHNKAKTIQ